jgi:hypothetical protein
VVFIAQSLRSTAPETAHSRTRARSGPPASPPESALRFRRGGADRSGPLARRSFCRLPTSACAYCCAPLQMCRWSRAGRVEDAELASFVRVLTEAGKRCHCRGWHGRLSKGCDSSPLETAELRARSLRYPWRCWRAVRTEARNLAGPRRRVAERQVPTAGRAKALGAVEWAAAATQAGPLHPRAELARGRKPEG